jgi:hypothetical protein
MILARRSSPRANRKLTRSAPVPGRSNVANQAVLGTSNAHRRPFLAAAGDGCTPPVSAFRHRQASCVSHAPRNPCGIRSAAVPAAAREQSSPHPKNPTLSGLAKLLRVRTPALRAGQTPIAPNVHCTMILARRSSQRDKRKLARHIVSGGSQNVTVS